MQIAILYAIVVLIWGSTWAAIKFQLGDVAEELSVSYRFAIAAAALYIYALISGRRLRLPAATLPAVFLQGALLFSLNYFFVYYGTAHITTGLVAVLFTSIVILNAFFERVFFGVRVDGRVVVASILGAAGIGLIFAPDVTALSLEDDTLLGIVLVGIAILLASLGNMAAVVNTGRGLPVTAVNAHGMAFASVFAFIVALALGRPISFSLDAGYVLSLMYLAVFGSSLAFGCYLALIRRIGAARASYSTVLFPIVALAISAVIEDYRFTSPAVAGILLTLAGSLLILSRRPDKQ